jgi:DNA-binding GntR family transcriptional regulator
VAVRPDGNASIKRRLSGDWSATQVGGAVPAHRTLAEKAFISLHDAILTGTLRPGERIPIEDLASALELSPMPVREAIRRLDALGLVENIPHKGARVTELSIEDLREIYEARLSLEPLAIARAAQLFTPEDEARAKELLAFMKSKEASPAALWKAHSELHMCLYRASRSTWLVRLIQPPWESSERYRHAMDTTVNGPRHFRNHEVLVGACVHHDPERAAAELTNHLVATANSLSGQLGGKQLFSPVEGDRLTPLAMRLSLR